MRRKLSLGAILVVVLLMALAVSTVYGGTTAQERGASGDVLPDSYIVVLQDGASVDDVVSAHGPVVRPVAIDRARGAGVAANSSGSTGARPPQATVASVGVGGRRILRRC